VQFNGTTAATTSWSATSIGATVPSGATTCPAGAGSKSTSLGQAIHTLSPNAGRESRDQEGEPAGPARHERIRVEVEVLACCSEWVTDSPVRTAIPETIDRTGQGLL
jgi:hypothetical protein